MTCPVGFNSVKAYCRKQRPGAKKINVLGTNIPKGIVDKMGKKILLEKALSSIILQPPNPTLGKRRKTQGHRQRKKLMK